MNPSCNRKSRSGNPPPNTGAPYFYPNRIVKPETVIAWHHKGFRLYWSWKSRPRKGLRIDILVPMCGLCDFSGSGSGFSTWTGPTIVI